MKQLVSSSIGACTPALAPTPPLPQAGSQQIKSQPAYFSHNLLYVEQLMRAIPHVPHHPLHSEQDSGTRCGVKKGRAE